MALYQMIVGFVPITQVKVTQLITEVTPEFVVTKGYIFKDGGKTAIQIVQFNKNNSKIDFINMAAKLRKLHVYIYAIHVFNDDAFKQIKVFEG